MELPKIDYAKAINQHFWLQHPIIGSPSWDSIEREPNNPIYIGKIPYEWPVNGYLFQDPPTKIWYAYIGMYPKNYWPTGGCLLLKEITSNNWKEIGIILEGDPKGIDGDGVNPGGMPDVSIVYEKGKYHMVYDWGNPTNTKGGIAYAWSESPEGPFHRDPKPIHLDLDQPLLLNRYQRVYAATLFRRENDWLILAMMSTTRNAGGTWALVGLRSENPNGPYSEPKILLAPQSNHFHPVLAEFYPSFEFNTDIYVPATSVAKNRTFQVLFKVKKEEALNPDQWEIMNYGGIWHDCPDDKYEQGIWGQTFSGNIFEKSENEYYIRYLSFTKTLNNIGAALISNTRWPLKFRNSFQIASPYAKSTAILIPNYDEFELNLEIKPSGPWTFAWGCNNPIGANHNGADSVAHNLMLKDRIQLVFEKDTMQCESIDRFGKKKILLKIQYQQSYSHAQEINLKQSNNEFSFFLQDHVYGPFPNPNKLGRIELQPQINTVIEINKFEILGQPKTNPLIYLATEGLVGAASEKNEWKKVQNRHFRYHEGFISTNDRARAKWNVTGSKFAILTPRHPKLGKAKLIVDGKIITEINFFNKKAQKSAIIYEFSLPVGQHAIIIEPLEGRIVIDCISCIF